MRIVVARALAVIGLLSTLLWAALPAVAVTCPMPGQGAGAMGECSSCCEAGLLTVGGVACVGCQAGVAADIAAPQPPGAVMVAWLAFAPPAVVGIDLSPADPPPR